MILAAILWIFEAALLFLYGRIFLRVLRPIFGSVGISKASPILTLLIGLVLVTSLASFLSIFMNLSFMAVAIFTIGGVLIFIKEWRQDGFIDLKNYWAGLTANKRWLLVALLLIGLVLDLSTRRPANPDTGIYHAQAIRWIESYSAVPGLGNLHTRLAFNSAWLVINALFSLAYTGIQSFHVLPGLWLAIFFLFALEGVRKIFQGNAQPSDCVKAFLLPLSIFTIGIESSSPGTDFPAILLIWFVLVEWMAEREEPGGKPFRPLVLAWVAIFAVTVKLSVAPIGLFSLIILGQYLRKKEYKYAGILSVGVALILFPWMARNLILSGYLIYPMPAIDLFSVDWKIPPAIAAREQNVIQAWARIPREDNNVVQAMSLATWTKIWYANQHRSAQAMLWGSLLLPLTMAGFHIFSRKLRQVVLPVVKRYGMAYLVFLAGLCFWFVSAPDFRFGYGFVLGVLLLGLIPWLVLAKGWVVRGRRWIAIGLILVTVVFWGMNYSSFGPKTIINRLINPTEYGGYSTAPCLIKDKTILCAQWYGECGYGAFPCIPSMNPEVELRGLDFNEGFRHYSP